MPVLRLPALLPLPLSAAASLSRVADVRDSHRPPFPFLSHTTEKQCACSSFFIFISSCLSLLSLLGASPSRTLQTSSTAGAIAIIPQDKRTVFLEAFRAAREEMRIEICVLEDPTILQGV
jgi:hypothetical protein